MSDSDFIKFIAEHRVFASLEAPSAESALRAAEAAILGGLKLVEVSLSTPGQDRVISELRRVYEVARAQCLPFVTGLSTRKNSVGHLPEAVTGMLMTSPSQRPQRVEGE